MTPIDYRNETFAQILDRVGDLQWLVYNAFKKHGPGTTRQLAEKSGIDLLTLRPRVSELFDLGLIDVPNPDAPGREGIYRAVPLPIALDQFNRKKAAALATQLELL